MKIKFTQKAIDFGVPSIIKNADGTFSIGVNKEKMKEFKELYPGEPMVIKLDQEEFEDKSEDWKKG